MQTAISRRQCALLIGSFGLSTLGGGCSSLLSRKPESNSLGSTAAATAATAEPIRVVYRTRTDRLNLAGAHLPHCSIAELRIAFPHAQSSPGVCSAAVQTTPCSADATPFPERGVTSSVKSLFDDAASSTPTTANWSADVALWEVQAIVDSLEKLNFFRKHRSVLTAEVFLSVETAQQAVGKKYRPVSELDAMILRIAQVGDSAGHGATSSPQCCQTPSLRAELARLPAIEQCK